MLTDIKAIFFDLDGTLVDIKTNRIPESTQAALRALRQREVRLFIASGRPPLWVDSIRDQFDFMFDGKVLLNGQYCVDETDPPFYQHPLTVKQCQTILDWMKIHPDVICNFMEPNYVYTNHPTQHGIPVEAPTRCLTHATYQISPQVGPQSEAEILKQTPGVKSARWNDTSTDLIPYDGGKPVGMQKMLKHFGLNQNQCMAFGDGANDIEMLQYAEIGVAMGNGSTAVKQNADYTTDAVDKNGIQNALRHFGLL